MWILIANSSGDGIVGTLDSSYYKGQGERQGIEREYIVVQDKTGTLSPGAHAGSYNGQDAYNGMLVNAEDRRVQRIESSVSTKTERLQGRNGFSEGGVEDETC